MPAGDSGSQKTMRRTRVSKNPIAFVWWVVLLCCLVIISISVLRLPDIPLRSNISAKSDKRASENDRSLIGKFGEMMIEMLPEDLAFTVFVPSEEAFVRDLKMNPNDSFAGEKMNDTYAVVSRVLGFSAVPRSLSSGNVPAEGEISYDSISGFVLYISKDDEDGALVVNRVRSKRVDLRRKKSIVHIMDGVVMDADFQQAFQGEED